MKWRGALRALEWRDSYESPALEAALLEGVRGPHKPYGKATLQRIRQAARRAKCISESAFPVVLKKAFRTHTCGTWLMPDSMSLNVILRFGALLLFYRADAGKLSIERVMHGARNLPKRMVEPPK